MTATRCMPALAPVLRCADRRCTWQVRLARDMWISAVQRLSVAETVALYDTENVRLLGTVDTEGEWVLRTARPRAPRDRVLPRPRAPCHQAPWRQKFLKVWIRLSQQLQKRVECPDGSQGQHDSHLGGKLSRHPQQGR